MARGNMLKRNFIISVMEIRRGGVAVFERNDFITPAFELSKGEGGGHFQ